MYTLIMMVHVHEKFVLLGICAVILVGAQMERWFRDIIVPMHSLQQSCRSMEMPLGVSSGNQRSTQHHSHSAIISFCLALAWQ